VAHVIDARVPAEESLPAPGIAARDQPLVAALVFGTLRWHERLEWQCGQLLSRALKPGQSALAALLRVGLLQLQELRIPEHAAVSATVDAAALLGLRRAAPLVNAVLRRYQRERERLELEQARVPRAHFAHPAWLIEAVRADYPEAWERVLDANNEQAPLWLRVNLAATTREAYLAELAARGLAAVTSAEVASAVRLAEPVSVEELPGFAEGRVSVQDVAAQRAAGLLDLEAGQRVLDACAAPGGKTGHILEALGGRGEVWAVDREPRRLTRVGENLERLRLAARVVAGDATAPGEWWDGRPFDRILLDAPCSAVGVIRRHPDIKLLRRPADVARVVTLQGQMLRALWPLLAPGGRLVYATCTVLKRENETQIATFCGAEPTARLVGQHQLLPGEAQGDGFYYAWLHKADVPRPSSGPAPQL
jgi:16S rRNA (cytosine967-C5)-methyltransferase